MTNENPTKEIISLLRQGRPVTLFDRTTKYFYHIRLNKKAKRVCWQRHQSKDRVNWVELNHCLSLKEILDFRAELAIKNQAACFHAVAV